MKAYSSRHKLVSDKKKACSCVHLNIGWFCCLFGKEAFLTVSDADSIKSHSKGGLCFHMYIGFKLLYLCIPQTT